MRHSGGSDGPPKGRKRTSLLYKTDETFPDADVFRLLRQYMRRGGVLGAGTTTGKSNDDSTTLEGGLAAGHAYSLLAAVKVEGFRLVQRAEPVG